jgi:N-acyl-D-aspartate/D-glutamate deacylase
MFDNRDNKMNVIISWGSDQGNKVSEESRFVINIIIIDKGKVFSFDHGAKVEGNTFNDNIIFVVKRNGHEEEIEVNLSDHHCSKKVINTQDEAYDFIRNNMTDVAIPKPHEPEDVGPCSGISSYALEDALEELGRQ